jgi:hypothetical protein
MLNSNVFNSDQNLKNLRKKALKFKDLIITNLKDLKSEDFIDAQEFKFSKFKLLLNLKLNSNCVTDKISKREFNTSIILYKKIKIHIHYIFSFIEDEEYNAIIESLKSTGDQFFIINFIEVESITKETFSKIQEKDQISFVYSELKCYILNDLNLFDFKLLGENDKIISKSEQPPLSGEISFVFTDIVDSCKTWSNHYQAMKKIIFIYFKMIRSIGDFGYEVKTIGDAFFFVFKEIDLP